MNSVFRADRYTGVLRRWVAAGASCALVLQLLLSAVALGHFTVFLASTDGDALVICHGAGTSTDQNEPGKLPPEQSHCPLCTVSSTPCAVMPAASVVVAIDPGAFSQLNLPRSAQVTVYHSPTGEYQRGPPLTHTHVAG
jgi:hypothetical protein